MLSGIQPQPAAGIIKIEFTKGEKCRYNPRIPRRLNMRILVILLSLLMLTACSSMAASGSTGSSAESQADRPAHVQQSDNAITRSIERGFSTNSMLRATNLTVRTHSGVVTLTGTVRKQVSRDKAVEISKNTDGVVAVNNLIKISGEDE